MVCNLGIMVQILPMTFMYNNTTSNTRLVNYSWARQKYAQMSKLKYPAFMQRSIQGLFEKTLFNLNPTKDI